MCLHAAQGTMLTRLRAVDRRVRCDRSLPSCANCARLGRKCQGYGMRLFWPKDNDPKRAMLGKSPPVRKRWNGSLKNPLIHTSFYDMEMHSYLLGLSTMSKHLHPTPRVVGRQLRRAQRYPFPRGSYLHGYLKLILFYGTHAHWMAKIQSLFITVGVTQITLCVRARD